MDKSGNVLSRTTILENMAGERTSARFGQANELEKTTLELLQQQEYGTVFGSGMPPREISGFYSLKEAPWTLVLIVPGEQALLPVSKFRNFYILTGTIGILLALLLIRQATVGTTSAIGRLTCAANSLANGDFGPPLAVTSSDEIGELTRNFNLMTSQLKERMELQQALGVACEVQKNMLPQSSYSAKGLAVSGVSLYCRETGGDYFDILPDRLDPRRVSVVVGDVVGHGIGAALQMATIRALVRCRASLPGNGAEIMDDVNEMLCRDTVDSGDFVTLFYLDIDLPGKLIRWVRCGHDPALIYDCVTGDFSELRGDGLVLGCEPGRRYNENIAALDGNEQIILIGSDGVWGAEDPQGERFGRERVRSLLVASCHLGPEDIIARITGEIVQFCGDQPQGDDITLLVAKVQ